MNDLLTILLSLSISGSLLIIVLFLCKPLLKENFSKQWQYYIWLIVIVRLLLPFAPERNLVGDLFRQIDTGFLQAGSITAPDIAPVTDSVDRDLTGGHISEPSQNNPKGTAPAANHIINLIVQNLWLIWLLVAVILLIRKITIYQSFVKYMKAGQQEVSDIELWEKVGRLVDQAGVKSTVSLYTNSLISSPLLIGFFHPCMILPTTELTDSDFEYTILHELTHYKRKDMFYKWLVQITVCIHWFNPLVHLMGREINRSCELSCDEAIIQKLGQNEQQAYGDTLLNAVGIGGSYKDAAASITLYENQLLLKERLDAIMKFKKKSKLTAVFAVVLTFTLCFGATTAGAYSKGVSQTPDTPRVATSGYEGEAYSYSQAGYYQAPYMFEIGRNLSEKQADAYPDKANITLSDLTTISISFDSSCKEYTKDENALAALKLLLEKLVPEYADSSLPLKTPLILSAKNVGNSDLNQLAEEYYSDNAMTSFVAIFQGLDKDVQKMYSEKMYKDNKIAFFSASLKYMDPAIVKECAQNAYEEKNIAFFSIIVPFLTKEETQVWIAKAAQDGRTNFLSVLTQSPQLPQSSQLPQSPQLPQSSQPSQPPASSSGLVSDLTKELSISLNVNNGGVEILPADSNEIKAEYDSDYYDVRITDQNGKWSVKISGKVAMMGKTDWVQLHIPNIKTAMEVNVLEGDFSYALPEACADNIMITARDAGITFTSNNKYKNSKISLSATDQDFVKYEPPVYPDYFKKTNTGFEYTNGTEVNEIKISLTGYTSVEFLER